MRVNLSNSSLQNRYFSGTNAEASRQTEMCMIYNEAWGNAKRGIPLASEETVNVDNMQSSFDAKA